MSKAIILLSGGMDSATMLYFAHKVLAYRTEDIVTVSADYGQVHKEKERLAAVAVARSMDVPVRFLDIPFKMGGALTGASASIPDAADNRQQDTIVPARNAVLLATVASYAINWQHTPCTIFLGATRDDFRVYGDCRPAFVWGLDRAFTAAYGIGVSAPFVEETKTELVRRGLEIGVPYHLTYSCYKGGDAPCMACDACTERMAAMRANGVNYYGQG